MTASLVQARPRRRRLTTGRVLGYVAGLAMAAVVVVPLLFVVIGGFRTTGAIADKPFGLPHPWVPKNYTDILTSGAFRRQVWNSVFIGFIVTTAVVLCGATAAYPISRFKFPGREGVYSFFTLGLLFPASVAVLPLYLLLRNLNVLDTPWAVAAPEAAFGLPVTIVILRPFMRSIPGEIEDAAVVDGCSRFGFFWRILLPLSVPALVTVGILAFITSWNAFLLPLLLLSDANHYTLPLGTAAFSSQYSSDTALVLAFTSLSMLPALAFFVLAQRRIVGGLTGAVKG
jgi:raffinose/stachyose/melibiose transport system permease protein